MSLLNWFDRYSVGVEALDSQHKELFSIFNKLFKVDTRKDANDAGKVIDELITYTHHHFNTEEAYLDSINYAEIEKQINEHKYFITILGELTKENIRNDKLLRKQLIVHLSHWIYHHILEEDKKYSIQQ